MKQILILALVLSSYIAFSQDDPIKWGKISQQEVDLKVVDYDSSATAVILCDAGKIYVNRGDGVIFRRHIRIKILDAAANDQADIVIPFYHKTEKIISQNAQTINVENGKPKKSEVSKKDFFKATVNENWSELRFTFPEVRAGSIIEYAYSVESENYTNLESWNFQSDIPTLKSHFHASIDGQLQYNIMYQGPQLIKKYGSKPSDTWELTDLPAIKPANFCPNPFDYTEEIKFQLSGYLASSGFQSVMGSWRAVSNELYDDGGWKQYLNKNKDASLIVNQIVSQKEEPGVKVQKIYDYIVKNYSWNGKYRLFPKADYKEFKSNGTGSSSEINLFFINLIQSAGLEAIPSLVSTKRNGIINKNITFYTQFNHLIACVRIDGKDILIDATSRFRPYTLLDQEDLGNEALVMKKKDPYWIPIPPFKKNKHVKLITMDIPEPGLVKYKLEFNNAGYEAVNARTHLSKLNDNLEDYFSKKVIKKNTEYQISNITSKNLEDIDKPLYISGEIIDNTSSTVNDDFIYLNPFVDRYLDSNPFNEKERYLPVDFYYPFEDAYILNFKIPEGYEVVECPESLNLATEGNKGILKFNSSLNSDGLQLRINFAIKDPFFNPYEYPALREIYDRYIEKREEQIVLKKKG